jgi:tryptophan synthase alpha chain
MSDGVNGLDQTFSRLRASGELGLFPFLTAGFPDRSSCGTLLDVIADAGADGLELGIPFSDPLADGVTIQRASTRALDQGASLPYALELVAGFRERRQIPVVIMSYVNPLMSYGYAAFARDAAKVGVDGVIVPDLPLEEADSLREACASAGLHYVHMVAPTSAEGRIRAVGSQASGFLYCVALIGTTGARSSLASELPEFLQAVRSSTTCPLVAGLGISTPEHIAALAGQVDGVIVGSALVDLIERADAERVTGEVRAYIRTLKAACRGSALAR